MADRWTIVEGDDRWEVQRNGRWYSDANDETDAIGIVRGYRADKVVIIEADGIRRTMKMR